MTRQLDITPELSRRRLYVERQVYIYFIQAGENGPVKIGTAVDPSARLEGFQCGNHEELTLLAFGPGTQSEERELHQKFARARIRGEWFKPTKSVLRAAEQYNKRMVALRQRWKEERPLFA